MYEKNIWISNLESGRSCLWNHVCDTVFPWNNVCGIVKKLLLLGLLGTSGYDGNY